MFEQSPLFQQAARDIQQAARRAFRETTVGRLVHEARAAYRGAAGGTQRVTQAVEKYRRLGLQDALRTLRGTEFGRFAREVERYAKGDPTRRIINQILEGMGPAGRLVQALVGPGARLHDELEIMGQVLRSFGYDVRAPGDTERDKAYAEYLRKQGWQVVPPGQQGVVQKAPSRGERPAERRPPHEFGQEHVERSRLADLVDEWRGRVPADSPLLTGEMVPTPHSDNVHSVGYDIDSQYLYVRFLGYVRGAKGSDGHALRAGPGSLYRYWPVLPEEFDELLKAADTAPGEWIWDNLRVRGTFSQHRKNYELVGVMQNYVPRQAMVRKNPRTGQREEWFVRRQVTTLGGERLLSQLPTEAAGPWGEPDRGRPDRGEPDRGQPDRGLPDRG